MVVVIIISQNVLSWILLNFESIQNEKNSNDILVLVYPYIYIYLLTESKERIDDFRVVLFLRSRSNRFPRAKKTSEHVNMT